MNTEKDLGPNCKWLARNTVKFVWENYIMSQSDLIHPQIHLEEHQQIWTKTEKSVWEIQFLTDAAFTEWLIK